MHCQMERNLIIAGKYLICTGELEDGEEHEGPLSSAPDNLSDRYDKDDEGPSDGK